ncbi:hypothetical protein MTO96_007756 [Rhipicephalus appendiculatus]
MPLFYITILSIGACGGGAIAGAFCPNIAWMSVAIGGLYGIGFGATITCFSMYTLTYFDQYRATATAVKYASWSAAGLVAPSLLSMISGYYGLHAPSIIESFECFVALNMILGVCQGYVLCIRTVLISEYLGIQCLPLTAGLEGCFLLPISLSGPTIVGFFRDTLGSYDNLYVLLGAINLFSAAMLSVLVCRDCTRRKSKWTPRNINEP